MKRLSMEIERERWAHAPGWDASWSQYRSSFLFMLLSMQAGVHGEEQTSAGPTEGAQDRDWVFEAGGAAAAGRALQPPRGHQGIRPGARLHTSQQRTIPLFVIFLTVNHHPLWKISNMSTHLHLSLLYSETQHTCLKWPSLKKFEHVSAQGGRSTAAASFSFCVFGSGM